MAADGHIAFPLGNENDLESDSSDGCTTPELYIVRFKRMIFTICELHPNFKKEKRVKTVCCFHTAPGQPRE